MTESIERQKVKQRLLLDNFFTCSKEKEQEYILRIASISRSLVIDLDEIKEKKLYELYRQNRDAMRGPDRSRDGEMFTLLSLGGLAFGGVMGVVLCAGLSAGVALAFITGGVGLVIAAAVFVAAAYYLGTYLYDSYNENKTNLNFEYEFDVGTKLAVLIDSKLFDTIDCPNCHFYSDTSYYAALANINNALNSNDLTAVILPKRTSYDSKEYNETKPHISRKLSLIQEKSKHNEFQNKYSLFFHRNSTLIPEMRSMLFNLLKLLHFPTMNSFSFYKELKEEERQKLGQ
ncbi:MAG: hypothetical protein H0T84_01615 [Tatlockia sp.]|nr:hypothetical protein [Tatlockia sp.]